MAALFMSIYMDLLAFNNALLAIMLTPTTSAKNAAPTVPLVLVLTPVTPATPPPQVASSTSQTICATPPVPRPVTVLTTSVKAAATHVAPARAPQMASASLVTSVALMPISTSLEQHVTWLVPADTSLLITYVLSAHHPV